MLPEIDPDAKIDHIARMTVAEREITKLLPKSKKDEPKMKSQAEEEEARKDYKTRMLEDQLLQMQGKPPDPITEEMFAKLSEMKKDVALAGKSHGAPVGDM